jgi:dihydrofolate synthase/folylpolyglutamate synthase
LDFTEKPAPAPAQDWLERYLDRLGAAPRQSPHGGPRSGFRALLRRHGHPQRGLNAIRIAGSKGKGSTALILEAALLRTGARVGVFTSPHLQRWNERIRINGREVAPADFAGVLETLAPDVESLRVAANPCGPDFFEVCLVAALILFHQVRTDFALVECGIGARGDATAVLAPALSIITTVEREHLNLIGPRLTDVARDKAGVIRGGIPVITGRIPQRPKAVLQSIAAGQDAPLAALGTDFHIRRLPGAERPTLVYRDGGELRLPVGTGLYWLADSVAIAVAALRRLPGAGIADQTLTEALHELSLPGRLELFPGRPAVLADGAHTRASTALLARALLAGRSGTLVISCSNGHDARAFAPALWRWPSQLIVTRADPARSQSAEKLAGVIQAFYDGPIRIEAEPQRALRRAVETTPAAGLVAGTGSVYMAGQARTFGENRSKH